MRGERFVRLTYEPFAPLDKTALSHQIDFAGPVVIAGSLHPIPSRTRSLKSPALMVLRLKAWESKSPPGLQSRFDPSSIFSTALLSAVFFVPGGRHVSTLLNSLKV